MTTFEYLNYEKIPGVKKFEATTKNYDVKIPPTEMDGRTQLLGSCTTVNCTVQYYLRNTNSWDVVFFMNAG